MRPVEKFAAWYMGALIVVMAVRWRHVMMWPWPMLLTFVMIAAALVMHRARGRAALFIRDWFPMLLSLYLYKLMAFLVFLFFPQWLDYVLIDFEHGLLGAHPTVWLEDLSSRWLTEIMMLGYFSYYAMLPFYTAAYYFAGQREVFARLWYNIVVAFSICFVGFIVFPVEGPRFALAELHQAPLQGYVFMFLTRIVERIGMFHGGCFPSAHSAAAWIMLWFCWRHRKDLLWFMLPLLVLMYLGTFYGRYHYPSDTVAGILVGILTLRLTGARSRRVPQSQNSKCKGHCFRFGPCIE